MKKRIEAAIEIVSRRVLPSYVTFDQNRNDRSGALYKAWGHVISNNLRGSYYEFGVYKGDSLFESQRIYNGYYKWLLLQKKSDESWRRNIDWYIDHRFYAFDTFEGIPDNDEGHHAFQKGAFLGELQQVRQKLNRLKSGDQISYFKGEFGQFLEGGDQKLPELEKVAIANIDCDLYLSTRDALEIIRDKLQQGAVLMMDDWYQFEANNNKGQRKALKEFLQNNKQIELEDYFIYSHAGKAFIVHLKTRSQA